MIYVSTEVMRASVFACHGVAVSQESVWTLDLVASLLKPMLKDYSSCVVI